MENNNNKIKVTIGEEVREYEKGTLFGEIAEDCRQKYNHQIGLVIADGKIMELGKKLSEETALSFITMDSEIGHKTYVRSAIMLFVKAAYDIIGREKIKEIKVEFAIGNGYYCSGWGDFRIDKSLVDRILARMYDLVRQNIPIIKTTYPIKEALSLFHREGMEDKVKLFRYRRSSFVNVYCLDGFYDYYYGYMLPSTGYVKHFDLMEYEKGFMLLLPGKDEPDKVACFEPRKKLFDTMEWANTWGVKLGIDAVGDLNDQICAGKLSELVLVQEALQESKIGEIAKEIVDRGGVKFIMIAGPSSSGKTTFSHRIAIQLRTHGLTPHPIAVDDYFVNRDRTPKDEDGNYNFECLEAIDVEQFNSDMCSLLEGKSVELPSFNFKTGKREYKGNVKKLGPDDILVIEGIHALNDKMSHALPGQSKFKIYISALTTLNIDEHNRISTTDGRLLRRMVRDARTRGASAKRTIEMWDSVRRGEEENIFPFQESADATFNSALIYELAVIKQFAEPLLFNIKESDPEYHEARRLLKFLEYFLGVSSEDLPNNSIIREFVGGSCLNV